MDNNLKNKIVQDFGLTSMDSEEQEKYIERIGNLLFESVIERSVSVMDDNSATEFESFLSPDNQDYHKVISFLQERVPGFSTIVSEEMARLKRASSGIFA